MINIKKQIEYWINSAESDLETAELLIQNNKFLHGLFFCHLVIEKAIKSKVVKVTESLSPKSHNLLYLIELSNLHISEDYESFLGILMKYQLSGRYPDYEPYIPDKTTATVYLEKTREILKWLKNQ